MKTDAQSTPTTRFALDLTLYIDAESLSSAADTITALLYDAIASGKIVDFLATGQPRIVETN